MSYYGKAPKSSTRKTYKPPTSQGGSLNVGSGGGGGGGGAASEGAGKGSINLFDVPGSIAGTAGSYAAGIGGVAGGVAGAIGGIGFGDGKNIGALADIPGTIGEAVGGIELPHVGDGPAATVGDIPGAAVDVVGAAGKGLERTAAGFRVQAARDSSDILSKAVTDALGLVNVVNPLNALPNVAQLAQTGRIGDEGLPDDLQERLDAGESVDSIADELLARGAGYSSNAGVNLVNQVLYDPLNLIAPGASKVGKAVKEAGTAIRVPEQYAKMGLSARAAGIAYSAASRGMSQGGAALMDKVIGPATSGAFHALGTKPYSRFVKGYGSLSPEYAQAIEDAGAVANANLAHAVIGNELADDIMSRLAEVGDDLDSTISSRLMAKRTVANDELQRRGQEVLDRTTPEFLGATADELDDFTARAMAMVTGSSPEDAARIVGRASLKDAKTAHWLRYGKAVDEMAEAREAARATVGKPTTRTIEEVTEGPPIFVAGLPDDALAATLDEIARRLPDVDVSRVREIVRMRDESLAAGADPTQMGWFTKNIEEESLAIDEAIQRAGGLRREITRTREVTEEAKGSNIDLDRLTLIADDTLTVERALALAKVEPGMMREVAMQYRVVANHFLGKNPSNGQIDEFIGKLMKEGALPEQVRTPKSGKNKLPNALSDFRVKWKDNGYELGFAPKDDVRIIKDADDHVVNVLPFIRQTTARDALTMRNPLGRFIDGLTRGVTQTTIVNESRQRMTRFIADAGLTIAPNQVRSIHQAILEEAFSRSVTPRALAGEKSGGLPVIWDIFKRFLSPEELEAVAKQYDPTYLVMRAFEGNWSTVGLTQKFTGKAKSRFPVIARIAEGIYPKARFTYRPTFQTQEMIESPTFNALRGVVERPVSDDLAKAYAAMAEQPEFRYLTEASFLNIAGDRMVQRFMGASDAFGRAMGRFTNIQARKEVARVSQVAHEHGDDFKAAIEKINPALWVTMREAYGTSDPRIIAERFLTERLRLASGDIDDVMAAVDDASGMAPMNPQLTGEIDNEVLRRYIDEDPDRAGFGYHITRASLEDIRESGLLPRDPKNGDAVGVYFGESARSIEDFVPMGNRGDNVLLRASQERLEPTFENPDELISADTIYPDELEYLADDGTWRPLLPSGPKVEPFTGYKPPLLDDNGRRIAPPQPRREPPDLTPFRDRPAADAKPEWATTPEGEIVWQAFRDSFREASVRAFKTHFFNPQRGWLERTLNHPYLGLYPLSYMWGKVLPEFARFLIARPFGARAPLVGFNAVDRVQQAYLGALQDDPEFSAFVENNANAIYFANLMFPGNPTNLAVNQPAWFRHVSEDAAAGREMGPETLAREAFDTAGYAFNPVGDVLTAARVNEDIFASLTRSAAEFDGMFPAR